MNVKMPASNANVTVKNAQQNAAIALNKARSLSNKAMIKELSEKVASVSKKMESRKVKSAPSRVGSKPKKPVNARDLWRQSTKEANEAVKKMPKFQEGMKKYELDPKKLVLLKKDAPADHPYKILYEEAQRIYAEKKKAHGL